jgi:hypothetical protein
MATRAVADAAPPGASGNALKSKTTESSLSGAGTGSMSFKLDRLR